MFVFMFKVFSTVYTIMAYVQLTNGQMVYFFMSVCMFLSIFNISLHKDISFFDQKANVWLIYVCIHVLRIFNISHHTGISLIDQKADGLLIYVCIYVLKYFNISLHNGISSIDQQAHVWLIYVCIFVLSILTFDSIIT